MKGMVFTAFIGFVEDEFGLEIADEMISATNSTSGGAYTSTGNYGYEELANMLQVLGELTGTSVTNLLHAFGCKLFQLLMQTHPEIIAHADNAFELIMGIDDHIHVNVLKLYPDAELPKFSAELQTPNKLELIYQSTRGLADLAHGLLEGCLKFFNEEAEISQEDLSGGQATHVRFMIEMKS